MEVFKAGLSQLVVEGKIYDSNQIREIMNDETKRAAYNGPSKIDYLATELAIPFQEAVEVLDAAIRIDTQRRVSNNTKILQIAGEMAERI